MSNHFHAVSTPLTGYSPVRGFSLLELMITIGIVMLVTGLALVRYSGFNNTVLLRSQAYELALDIRQAQVYGISASGQKNGFDNAYGIYFKVNEPTYILFNDSDVSPTSGTYSGSNEAVGNPYQIDYRFKLSDINDGSGGSCQPSEVSFTFKRPNFDAVIKTDDVDCNSSNQINLVLSTADGSAARTVSVYKTGFISVQ